MADISSMSGLSLMEDLYVISSIKKKWRLKNVRPRLPNRGKISPPSLILTYTSKAIVTVFYSLTTVYIFICIKVCKRSSNSLNKLQVA